MSTPDLTTLWQKHGSLRDEHGEPVIRLVDLAAAPPATTPALDGGVLRIGVHGLWDRFLAFEDGAAQRGSGATKDQMTGANLFFNWLCLDTDEGQAALAPQEPDHE